MHVAKSMASFNFIFFITVKVPVLPVVPNQSPCIHNTRHLPMYTNLFEH